MHMEQVVNASLLASDYIHIADDFEDDMMMEEDELIAPSPTADELFEEDGRFAGPRVPNIKVVDKNFFNDFPDLFDDDL
ncbi:hypothetical protein FBU30_004886 [Linnemannia zychae]|nr:hypothetical protein FBU30_004886 [Linnemannia zychae]